MPKTNFEWNFLLPKPHCSVLKLILGEPIFRIPAKLQWIDSKADTSNPSFERKMISESEKSTYELPLPSKRCQHLLRLLSPFSSSCISYILAIQLELQSTEIQTQIHCLHSTVTTACTILLVQNSCNPPCQARQTLFVVFHVSPA